MRINKGYILLTLIILILSVIVVEQREKIIDLEFDVNRLYESND